MVKEDQAQLKQTLIDTIVRFATCQSGSFNTKGLLAMQACLEADFRPLKAHFHKTLTQPAYRFNLRGREALPQNPILQWIQRPEAPMQILLLGHIDTVYSPEHPFQAVSIEGDKLIGPGVADMKGGIAILLYALKAFETHPLAKYLGWQVVLTPDEEIGSLGSLPFLRSIAPECHLALVFEPAMDEAGSLAFARKGSGRFIIRAKGKAAHAGRDFAKGKNAIVALSRLLPALHALNDSLHPVTLNIGRIQGGEADNMVPDWAAVSLDIRYSNTLEAQYTKAALTALVQDYTEKTDVPFVLEGDFYRPPKQVNDTLRHVFDELDTVAKSLQQTLFRRDSGGCCDGNNLWAEMGLPNIDSLGVCGGKLHSEGEYLLISQLLPRYDLIKHLLIYFAEKVYQRGKMHGYSI